LVAVGAIEDIGDIGSIGRGIGAETKTKEGVIAGNRELVVFFAGERTGGEVEIRRGREFHSLSRDGVVMAKAMEMLDVGRGICGGKIVHAFVETSVVRYLDALGQGVKPKFFFQGAWEITKENAFARMGLKEARAATGRTDPNTGTKGAEL
jgi:hypothetical protein